MMIIRSESCDLWFSDIVGEGSINYNPAYQVVRWPLSEKEAEECRQYTISVITDQRLIIDEFFEEEPSLTKDEHKERLKKNIKPLTKKLVKFLNKMLSPENVRFEDGDHGRGLGNLDKFEIESILVGTQAIWDKLVSITLDHHFPTKSKDIPKDNKNRCINNPFGQLYPNKDKHKRLQVYTNININTF